MPSSHLNHPNLKFLHFNRKYQEVNFHFYVKIFNIRIDIREMNSMSGDFNMDSNYYVSGAEILELLGSLSRLLIVRELVVSGTLTVSQLSAATHISEPMILQHLRKLTLGNIVISERKGTRLYCRIEDKKVIDIINLLGLLY